MISHIIEMLSKANGETENIRIAQGKYKLPSSIKDGFKQLKNELQWQKKN
jgi:hypothetical protein